MPWQFHFDFHSGDRPVLSSTKRIGLRDRYAVTFPDDGKPIDWRVAACLGVALDALQGR